MSLSIKLVQLENVILLSLKNKNMKLTRLNEFVNLIKIFTIQFYPIHSLYLPSATCPTALVYFNHSPSTPDLNHTSPIKGQGMSGDRKDESSISSPKDLSRDNTLPNTIPSVMNHMVCTFQASLMEVRGQDKDEVGPLPLNYPKESSHKENQACNTHVIQFNSIPIFECLLGAKKLHVSHMSTFKETWAMFKF
jgi:hypothetical protein